MINLLHENNTLRLDGEQTFYNADRLNEKGLGVLQGLSGDIFVDTGTLTNFNSALLAILMQWQHKVSGSNGRLQLINAPDQLKGLIQLTQLDEYLILTQ